MKKSALSLDMLNPFFEKLSKLTRNQKIFICIGVVVLLIAPAVYFVYMPKHQKIDQLTSQYESLVTELNKYKSRAKQLSKYKAEIKEVEAQFDIARRALPESEEIPTLLTSISNAGQTSHLEFFLFKPEKEKTRDFYADLPVSIKVTGMYHDVLSFFDKVSKLSRIVNVKNIKMNMRKGNKKDQQAKENLLDISCTAMTYKFIEKTNKPVKKKK